MTKQKFYGLLAIALGVVAAAVTGDGTASILLILIGISAVADSRKERKQWIFVKSTSENTAAADGSRTSGKRKSA